MNAEKLPLCRSTLPFWDSLEVAVARVQKEGVMKIQMWILEGCYAFHFFSRGS